MAYNYGLPPGAYNSGQPNYGPPSGPAGMGMGMGMGMGPPPTFGAPPGMDAAPGMTAPSPGGLPAGFQPPNLPANLDFTASVIRLGVDGPRQDRSGPDRSGRDREGRDGRNSNAEPLGNRGRLGLGADAGHGRNLERDRQQLRENMMALHPPTREEVSRTIFIGGLGEGMPSDSKLEDILRSAGKLRRWTRAIDADDRKCKFGFAEYEDVESLEAAAEIFKDIKVPLFNADGSLRKTKSEEGDEDKIEEASLLVVVDDASREYIQTWKGRKKESDEVLQFRLESCKEELDQTIASLINQASHITNSIHGVQNGDADGDIAMAGANGDVGEIVTIPLELEDDLADIPAEMRATVAEEIKAFRDRSNRRDVERLKREEEIDQEDKRHSGAVSRVSRLASPPPGTPSGPASAANGIPVGPRGQQGVQGAPSGPRGFRGAQIPSDYVNGVAFVPGGGANGAMRREDEDAEESDEELERRRQEQKTAERDQLYQDTIRKWQGRERARQAALERERKREESDKRILDSNREIMIEKLSNWDDDVEEERGKHIYYRDHSAWFRDREIARENERRDDERDRKQEQREEEEERRKTNEARGMADDFLGSMGMGADPRAGEPSGPAPFKISLGGAAGKTRQPQQNASGPKRVMADIEGLLEDEEDAAAAGVKRPELKPLQDTSTLPENGQDLSDEEKETARLQLASEIPTDTEPLFAHPIKWTSITPSVMETQIRPFVEKKILNYLGVQEDMIVDALMEGVKEKRAAKDIADELSGPLEDEAENLVKKVWRMLVFWGECESRGLVG